MVPAAYRGKRNRPAYLAETSDYVAELREMEVEDLPTALYANSLRFFGLDNNAGG